MNIADAYDDERFNQAVDRESGYRTREVACVPLTNPTGNLLGVLQVLNNKHGGQFNQNDMELLDAIAVQVGHAVENAKLAQQILDKNQELAIARAQAERRSAELDLLYELEQDAAQATDIDSLMESVIHWTSARVHCLQALVMLHGSHFQTLFSIHKSETGESLLSKETLQLSDPLLCEVSQTKPYQQYTKDKLKSPESIQAVLNQPLETLGLAALTHDSNPIGNIIVINPAAGEKGESESTEKLFNADFSASLSVHCHCTRAVRNAPRPIGSLPLAECWQELPTTCATQ